MTGAAGEGPLRHPFLSGLRLCPPRSGTSLSAHRTGPAAPPCGAERPDPSHPGGAGRVQHPEWFLSESACFSNTPPGVHGCQAAPGMVPLRWTNGPREQDCVDTAGQRSHAGAEMSSDVRDGSDPVPAVERCDATRPPGLPAPSPTSQLLHQTGGEPLPFY